MNLNAYDNIKEELDKHKTWYSPKFRRLYSREIKFRMFYKFMKRWNETIKRNDYFLAVSMNNVDGRFSITNKDNYSRLKFSIPKEINVGMLQLGIHIPTNDYCAFGKGDYIINIDEFNLNNDDINYVCNNALTLCK